MNPYEIGYPAASTFWMPICVCGTRAYLIAWCLSASSYAFAGGLFANSSISYGQWVSGGAPSCATDLIPSRISAPESWSTVPSIARSL